MDGKLQFTRQPDGRVTVDAWHQRIAMTDELLADASPKYLRAEGDLVTFTVANGFGQYVRVGYFPHERVGVYELLASSMSRTQPIERKALQSLAH